MGTRRPGYSRVVTTYSHGPISGSSLHREISTPSTRKRIDAGGPDLPKGGATTSPSLLSPTRSLLQTAVAVAAARRSARLVRAGVRSYSFSFCAFCFEPDLRPTEMSVSSGRRVAVAHITNASFRGRASGAGFLNLPLPTNDKVVRSFLSRTNHSVKNDRSEGVCSFSWRRVECPHWTTLEMSCV